MWACVDVFLKTPVVLLKYKHINFLEMQSSVSVSCSDEGLFHPLEKAVWKQGIAASTMHSALLGVW